MAENKTSLYSEPKQIASASALVSITVTQRLVDGKPFQNLVLEVAGRRFRLSEDTNFAEIKNALLFAQYLLNNPIEYKDGK